MKSKAILYSLLTLFVYSNNAFSLVFENQKGIAVYDFIEGCDDYDVDIDGSTLILGDWFDQSKAVYYFNLPPEVGTHKINYLKITVNGIGEIDNIKFGGPTAVNYSNITDTKVLPIFNTKISFV
ncbi:MAG: hypothetical protein FJ263_10590 [Planctomycetes bacterium]|nr:hypothetical protein [Planctomycetota bacterium]